MGNFKDKISRLVAATSLVGATALGAGTGLSMLEQAVSGVEAKGQDIGNPVVQQYSPSSGRATTNLSQRVSVAGESLESLTGIDFNSVGMPGEVLGTVFDANGKPIIYYNNTDNVANRFNATNTFRGYTLGGVDAVKTLPLQIPGQGNYVILYDGKTRLTAFAIVGNSFQPLGEVTQVFKNGFGFVPVDMQSPTPMDNTLYLKKYDGTWMGYHGPNYNQPFVANIADSFNDTSLAVPSSLVNRFQGSTDRQFAVRFPREGQLSDLEAVNDVISLNQNGIATSKQAGIISKFDMPIPVYVDSSVDKRNIDEALWKNFLETGIPYILLDKWEGYGIFVRSDTDGLGSSLGRGGIDGVFDNNRIKSGFVVLHPSVSSYHPEYVRFFQNELRHAMGLFGYIDTPNPLDIDRREMKMFSTLYHKQPHGSRLQSNGFWRVD